MYKNTESRVKKLNKERGARKRESKKAYKACKHCIQKVSSRFSKVFLTNKVNLLHVNFG
jgi:hypothetical protein